MRGAMVRRARHWIENRGWRGFLAEVWRRLGVLVRTRRLPGGVRAEVPQHPFDAEHGVDTGGLVFGEKLRAGSAEAGAGAREGLIGDSAYWATAYYGIAPSVLAQALDRLGLEWERYTFLDVGCGKGRAVMLATGYPFRAVTGVELSPELARVAGENLRRFRPGWRRVEAATVLCGDATTAELPAGPLVLLLYHPFAAPVMRRFLANVERALGQDRREVWILYANPELGPMLRGLPWLEVMWDECFGMSEEDRAADRFGSEWERMVAYRSVEGLRK